MQLRIRNTYQYHVCRSMRLTVSTPAHPQELGQCSLTNELISLFYVKIKHMITLLISGGSCLIPNKPLTQLVRKKIHTTHYSLLTTTHTHLALCIYFMVMISDEVMKHVLHSSSPLTSHFP